MAEGLFSKLRVVLQNVKVSSKRVGRSWIVYSYKLDKLNFDGEKKKIGVEYWENQREIRHVVTSERAAMLWRQKQSAVLSVAAAYVSSAKQMNLSPERACEQ